MTPCVAATCLCATVILARPDGGAMLAYSFSGAGNLPSGKPAFAGVATTTLALGADGVVRAQAIDIVRPGTGAIRDYSADDPTAPPTDPTQISLWFGWSSGASLHRDRMFFTASTAEKQKNNPDASKGEYGALISSVRLE